MQVLQAVQKEVQLALETCYLLSTLFELLGFCTRLHGCQLRFCYIYLDGVQVEQVFFYFQFFLRQVIAELDNEWVLTDTDIDAELLSG